jgi:hypothetical protein
MNNTNKKFAIPGIIGIVVLSSLNFSSNRAEQLTIKEQVVNPEVSEVVTLTNFNLQPASISQPIQIPVLDQSTIFTPEEIRNVLELAGFEGKALRTAFGIVLKESTGRPYAHNQNSATGDNSYGLFQINMIGSLGPARRSEFGLANNEELFSPIKNAQIAYIISDGGTNWGPWGGVSRKVLNFMNEFPE